MSAVKVNIVIDINNVISVYSGKQGCMCGCNGNHRYHSIHKDLAAAGRGYDLDDSDISDLAVKRMVNKFNKAGVVTVDQKIDGTYSDYCYIDNNDTDRTNVIYFTNGSIANQVK